MNILPFPFQVTVLLLSVSYSQLPSRLLFFQVDLDFLSASGRHLVICVAKYVSKITFPKKLSQHYYVTRSTSSFDKFPICFWYFCSSSIVSFSLSCRSLICPFYGKRKKHTFDFTIETISFLTQECIPVGCTPPACCLHLPACTAPWQVYLPGGVYLLGGVPAWGCTCLGVYLPGG